MIKDRKVRICMIGAGKMANNVHYPSLASFDDVEIVGVIETRVDRLTETCDTFGIPESARFLMSLDTDYQDILQQLRRRQNVQANIYQVEDRQSIRRALRRDEGEKAFADAQRRQGNTGRRL